jgi:hypothetical protein
LNLRKTQNPAPQEAQDLKFSVCDTGALCELKKALKVKPDPAKADGFEAVRSELSKPGILPQPTNWRTS